MANGLSTEVCVRRKVKDGWFVYTCEQLPGLYVAHRDDQVAYNDVPRAIALLLRLDLGITCRVTHKLGYSEFVKQTQLGELAIDNLEDRTRELMDGDHLPFIVQHVKDRHTET